MQQSRKENNNYKTKTSLWNGKDLKRPNSKRTSKKMSKIVKLFKNKKDKPPKAEIITEPKEPEPIPTTKCGKPLVLDNTRWEASIN